MRITTGLRVAEIYRENRILVWLSIVIFVNQLGFASMVPVVPLYARTFGVSQAAIGLAIAVYGFARLVTTVPSGQLADRLGRRWTLVLGELITALGNLLCGLAGTYEQFLFYRFIAGAGSIIVSTTAQVSLADISTRENRGRMMGIFQGVFMLGVGIGPLPGGILAERFGLNIPFFIYSAMGLLAAMVAFDKVPETRGLREKREMTAAALGAFKAPPLLVQLRRILPQVGFLLVSLMTFNQTFSRTGVIFAMVPVLGASRLGMGPEQIGLGLSLVSVVNLVVIPLSGVVVDRFGRKPAVVPPSLVSMLAMLILMLAPSPNWFMLGLAFWGLGAGISQPALTAYAADMAPLGMNAITMSSYRFITESGYVAGPLLLGWVADSFSSETALAATAGLFAVGTALFALFAPETGRKRRRAEVPAKAN